MRMRIRERELEKGEIPTLLRSSYLLQIDGKDVPGLAEWLKNLAGAPQDEDIPHLGK